MVGLSNVLALLIGAAEAGVLVWALSTASRRTRVRRRRPDPSTATKPGDVSRRSPRHPAGTYEQILVRQRLAGRIDAATYQARMADLVRGGR